MIRWINWEEAEKMSGWALTEDNGEYLEKWDERAEAQKNVLELGLDDWAAEQQVKAMHLQSDETVLDACCGAGRLTVPMAKYCKQVTGLDGGTRLLAALEERAEKRGITNISTLQRNWYKTTPGVDIPKFDVVMGCNSPALSDILKFSKAATKRCIYIHACRGPLPRVIITDLFQGASDEVDAAPVTSDTGDDDAWTCTRNSFDVTFNRLVSLNAVPTVNYCDGGWHVEGQTKEQVYDKIRPYRKVRSDREDVFRTNVDRFLVETEEGFLFERKHWMVVMEWDPKDITE